MEGFYKLKSINKVDKKVTEKLRLSSMGMSTLDYFKQKVLYEYGIISTWIRQNQIPLCSRYTCNKRGPVISFRVPESDSRVISSFNMCLVIFQHKTFLWLLFDVYNMST